MYALRQLRRFLNLRLIDVANAIGIPSQGLSLAERELLHLNPVEQSLVESFILVRMKEAKAVSGYDQRTRDIETQQAPLFAAVCP
jgi:hypothetical protein